VDTFHPIIITTMDTTSANGAKALRKHSTAKLSA
jgi:hypothetical protein